MTEEYEYEKKDFDPYIIYYEDHRIYDGWIAKVNLKTEEVELREFYKTENWSKEHRQLYVDYIKNLLFYNSDESEKVNGKL